MWIPENNVPSAIDCFGQYRQQQGIDFRVLRRHAPLQYFIHEKSFAEGSDILICSETRTGG